MLQVLFLSILIIVVNVLFCELNSYEPTFLYIMTSHILAPLLSLFGSFTALLLVNLGMTWYLQATTSYGFEFVLNYMGITCFFVGCGLLFILPFFTTPPTPEVYKGL